MKVITEERLITQQELKELISYDQESGVFVWIAKPHRNVRIGTQAGSIRKIFNTTNKRNYVRIKIRNKEYLAHRLAWLYMTGEYPKGQIDHIDGNCSNNRFDNLRDVTHRENGLNQRLPKRNTSGVCGVWWNKSKQRWQADIIVMKKKIFLGLFKDIQEASKSRKLAESIYGYHPNHGNRLCNMPRYEPEKA